MADGRCRLAAVLFAILIQVVNGYEETYTISQLSPKSAISDGSPLDYKLETSRTENLAFNIEPSAIFGDEGSDLDDDELGNVIEDEETEQHHIVARSADPLGERASRSINIDEIPLSNNNEIDNELEIHNKRKYYEIHPTKTVDFLHDRDEIILSSEGFGDRLDFRFPGEAERVPKARALQPPGPKIRPSAVQPIFATATPNGQGRQNNAEIQNIITGIVKLLNGNVNVQANSQLLNGRPGRPMNSRINNRGPPRIVSESAPLPPEFEKPATPFVPTKTPPPYPFDRPPHRERPPINLPEQIVPPVSNAPYRPGFIRPNLPPWHRPRPRPTPNRRPNPHLSSYNPNVPIPFEIPTVDLPEEKPDESEDILTLNDNDAGHSENNIHDEKETISDANVEVETDKQEIVEKEEDPKTTTTPKPKEEETTTSSSTTSSTTTSTTTTSTTTEKTTTREEATEQPTTKPTTTSSTTEKAKEKHTKPEKEKKKDGSTEKDKQKFKPTEDKQNKTKIEIETTTENLIEASITEKVTTVSVAVPTPTEGLPTHAPPVNELTNVSTIKTSSINSQPLPSSQGISYHPYRPRPGIVLDDPDFKPHGGRPRPEAAVITAAETHAGGYGEIFQVTVSAIQGPGEKPGAHVDIVNVNPLSGHADSDDIIVSASGEQGFVSIDGKRTYLNLFGDASTSVNPTPVLRQPGPTATPASAAVGTGIAIPADDIPQTPVRRPPPHAASRPHQNQQQFRRPQPTVRIDTCIVGDDSTCDQAQNEKCRTEGGISSCQCRPGYARRVHRDPCRRVVSLVLNLRVDRLYDRKVAWDMKLADKESEPYQQLSYEALRAIDSAFSMTPFSDDFVSGAVNSVHRGDQHHQGIYVNYTILMQETPETLRNAVATDIQRHLLGVIRRRSNNVGASALWVDTPAGAVMPPSDLDECASPELNDCHKLAMCTNTWGGFRCNCPETTRDTSAGDLSRVGGGRSCERCAPAHCNERGTCHYANNQPYCSCNSGYYGSTCEVDGEVVGVAVGASLAAALVIALTLAALLSWSRKWSREQKAAGMGSPVFNYMAANTIKAPPVGQPPYQVTLEERMRWAQIAEAMAANHYAQAESAQQMAVTRPSSALFGGYPTLPPVPLPRSGMYNHNGTMNTVNSRAHTNASHHNMYGYTNHAATESTSSEASSHVQERADLLVPRPKSRARSMHNQTGIYYDVEYENAPEAIYGTKGIPLSTYTVSRGPPFYRT